MDFSNFLDKMQKKGITVLKDEKMSEHTSFKIGGPVDLMILPKSVSEAETVLSGLRAMGEEPIIIGNGTNLLVTDSPVHKVAVKTHDGLGKMLPEGESAIAAGSGALLSRVAVLARERGLTGMEFAHGIPGTLGGAIMMNAGAYGGQMSDIINMVTFLDDKGERHKLRGDELEFGYRHSIFSGKNYFILGASIVLRPGNYNEIRDKMTELSKKRRSSQPLEFPSAGSTFKRPAGGYAASLIEQAGLKGYTVGGAQVSEKHSGFVINRGGATYCDVRKVMDHITQIVFSKFDIQLEPEVRIIE